jgi:hypothetical protein
MSTSTPGNDGPVPPLASSPTPAELRSQAVAKLKRAASLPRTPAGRRPPAQNEPTLEDSRHLTASQTPSSYISRTVPISPTNYEGQEVLSPSPPAYDHSSLYPVMMQRSISASSSFQAGSSVSYSPAYYSASSSPVPDWGAVQLAQSSFPSLSPLPPPSSFPTGFAHGRNTPSPLPSLGELRTLQRSNSAMARAHAMSKLTGGRNTPNEEGSVPLSNLTRSDSLGLHTILAAPTAVDTSHEESNTVLAASRPRLQRSFTVSSSNMNEERRSAVGRKMVARLGARRPVELDAGEEVRQIWQEKRAAASQATSHYSEQELALPVVQQNIPKAVEAVEMSQHQDALMVPERPISRSTMRSGEEAFEYESHLRRSLSSRTARGAGGTIPETTSVTTTQPEVEELQAQPQSPYFQLGPNLAVREAPFATPTRRQQDVTSTFHQSPSSESTMSKDGLGSMMFVMGGEGTDARKEGHWPVEVDHGSWGTPLRSRACRLVLRLIYR